MAGVGDAWIADMGEFGDFGRRCVLDPVMLPRALSRSPKKAHDVGCGEGRFCRMLKPHGVEGTGIDPTPALLAAALARDPECTYLEAAAERLPFDDNAFDLVISYLSLIDIRDMQAAISEMARVLNPDGAVLIANLNSFNTACSGWVREALANTSIFQSTTIFKIGPFEGELDLLRNCCRNESDESTGAGVVVGKSRGGV